MAKPILATDFKDDIMQEAMNGKRRYRMINNADGTVSFEDATDYEQIGNVYGAGQINATNEAVNQSVDSNKLVKELSTISAITQEGYVPDALAVKELNSSLGGIEFGLDTDGKGQYRAVGASKWTPFLSGHEPYIADLTYTTNSTLEIEVDFYPTVIAVYAPELTYYTHAGIGFAIRDDFNWSLHTYIGTSGVGSLPLKCTFNDSSVTITQVPGDIVTGGGKDWQVSYSIKVVIM